MGRSNRLDPDEVSGHLVGSGDCFFCHGELVDAFVYWSGETMIALHPRCAAEFAAHLLKDSLAAELDLHLTASDDWAFLAECMAKNWRKVLSDERARRYSEDKRRGAVGEEAA